MIHELPKLAPDMKIHLSTILDEYDKRLSLIDRRLYLTSEIRAFELDCDLAEPQMSICSQIVDNIMAYNREDYDIPVEERKPIRLYINSPGGDVNEGFAVISAIELSKTPVYTINIGTWYSMAFLIGISGHKRFSLPYMTFLMHDGTTFTFDSGSKAQDKMEFDRRYEHDVVRAHVLRHSNMKPVDYDALARVEYYLLPEDALERGFIDEIVTDFSAIF